MHDSPNTPKMNQMHYVKFAVALIFAVFTIVHPNAQISIATWNLKKLGRSKDAVEIHTIAQHLRDYDIVLIQEVVAGDHAGGQAVARLESELDRMGAEWESVTSLKPNCPSANITEKYAILWKPSRA